MGGSSLERGGRPLVWAGFALYAIVLVAAPYAHHDLLCHLRTPQHCTSCASSVPGADPASPATVGAWTLADLGSAAAIGCHADDVLPTVRTTGRSPPVSV